MLCLTHSGCLLPFTFYLLPFTVSVAQMQEIDLESPQERKVRQRREQELLGSVTSAPTTETSVPAGNDSQTTEEGICKQSDGLFCLAPKDIPQEVVHAAVTFTNGGA